MRLTLNNS
jgi:small nuclear ribonucleoprotein (snRNP)-like protein